MYTTHFDSSGLDSLGIHWAQYFAMTNISLLIFLTALDKAFPSFHSFILTTLSNLGFF